MQSPTSSIYSPRLEAAQQRDVDSMDPMRETRMLPSPMQPHSELVPPRRAVPPRPRGRELQSHSLATDFAE